MADAKTCTYTRPKWFGDLDRPSHCGSYSQQTLIPTGAENIEHAKRDMQPMFTIITNGKPVADHMVSAYISEDSDPTGLCQWMDRPPHKKDPLTVINIALGDHDELVINGDTEALRNIQFVVGNRTLDSRFPESQVDRHQDDARTEPLGTVRVTTDADMAYPLILKDAVHLESLNNHLMSLILCDSATAESVSRAREVMVTDHATLNRVTGHEHVDGYPVHGLGDGEVTAMGVPRPTRSVADRVAAKAAALNQGDETQPER